MKRIASLALILALALSLAAPVSAADKTTGTKMSLEEFDGTVTVRDAAGKDKTARADMRLYNGYTIATGKASSAYINLDDTAAVKLDRGTKVEIRTLGKQLDVHLLSGQLFFDTKVPRKADQSYTISTSTTVTGVRGSFGWVNLKQMGMVHGHSTVTYVDEETGKTVTIPITSGEGLSCNEDGGAAVSGNAGAFEKTVLTVEDIPAIVAEAIAADPQKQAQVDEVANLDTQEIVDSVDEKKEAEAQAEEKAEKTAEEAAEQQQEEIRQLDDADKKAGETNEVKLDADKKAEEEAKAREEAREERIREREEITEPPVQPSEPSQPSTPTKTFTVAPEQADLEDALAASNVTIYVKNEDETTYNELTIPSGRSLTIMPGGTNPETPDMQEGSVSFNGLTNNGKLTVSSGVTAIFNPASGNNACQNNGSILNSGMISGHLDNTKGSHYGGSGSIDSDSQVTFILTFNANGGKFSDGSTEYYSKVTYGSSELFAYAYTPTEPQRNGYTLSGWYTAPAATGAPLSEANPGGTISNHTTVYAGWSAVPTATVTVSAPNGATVELWREVGGLISATSTNVYQLVIGETVTLKVYNLTTQSNQQVRAVLVPTGAATTDPTSLNKDNSDPENAYYYCDLTVPNVADQTSYTLTMTEAISSGG
jgi:uncharacterized repeat protein (TIGR02543 family)